jgi:hypothetical protein
MAFCLHKRDGERHGFSNRHPYKTENTAERRALLQRCRLHANSLFLKGTGFGPYIHYPNIGRALAPEGISVAGECVPQRLKPIHLVC